LTPWHTAASNARPDDQVNASESRECFYPLKPLMPRRSLPRLALPVPLAEHGDGFIAVSTHCGICRSSWLASASLWSSMLNAEYARLE
jgi:hypothetical protein